MSLKSLMSGVLVVAVLFGFAAVVAPQAQARHRSEPSEPTCTCRASLGFSSPEGLFVGADGLNVPLRVDVTIRAQGETGAPPLNVALNYDGQTSYSSRHVSVPDGVAFSGSKAILENAPCNGRYKYSHDGLELTELTLPGLVRSLLGSRQRLEGVVQMHASLVGCGFEEEENRQFGFIMKQFGNLSEGGWGRAR